MRIICLSKRHPQGRDLYSSPYGRFYYLLKILADRGHEVHLCLLSYKNDPRGYKCDGNLHIHSVSALPWGPLSLWFAARALARQIQPDWIIGFSDIWYGILVHYLAKVQRTRYLIDAYDNFESYIPWATFAHKVWRHALNKADAVTAAGPQLADWMVKSSGRNCVEVIPMAADPSFLPLSRQDSRRKLDLPVNRRLVGYAGSLHPNRGIEFLFQVFNRLREFDPNIELVLSGRLAKGVTLPSGVLWLGYRPAEEVPYILNSMDLLFVINQPGDFGDYSYPAKLYEAMACHIPVVASNVAGTAWVLREHPEMLAQAGNVEDFVEKAFALIGKEVKIPHAAGWEPSSHKLLELLES